MLVIFVGKLHRTGNGKKAKDPTHTALSKLDRYSYQVQKI